MATILATLCPLECVAQCTVRGDNMASWHYNIGVEVYLTDEEMYENADMFYSFFANRGYTLESIAGMLGNIYRESHVNPGCKERESSDYGWGLIQWTPATILLEYATLHGWDWYDGATQCELIAEEIETDRGVWIPTTRYNYSGEEFSQLTDLYEATGAYCYERERPGVVALEERYEWAGIFYEYISGHEPPIPPTPPTPTVPTKSKMKLIYYLKPFYKL